jgi:nitroreductase
MPLTTTLEISPSRERGPGCCPISVLRNDTDAVADILGLADKVFPIAGLCAGYPAVAGHVSMRLPPKATVHIAAQPEGQSFPTFLRRRGFSLD